MHPVSAHKPRKPENSGVKYLVLKENSVPYKTTSKGEIKVYLDKQKLKEFDVNRCLAKKKAKISY